MFIGEYTYSIDEKKRLLIVKKSPNEAIDAGLWVVPGGKVKAEENVISALKREVKEETGLKIKIGRPFYVGEWRPVVRGEQWQIVGTFFECKTTSSKVKLSEDHEDYKWINPKDFKKHPLIENLKPAFKSYCKNCRIRKYSCFQKTICQIYPRSQKSKTNQQILSKRS